MLIDSQSIKSNALIFILYENQSLQILIDQKSKFPKVTEFSEIQKFILISNKNEILLWRKEGKF